MYSFGKAIISRSSSVPLIARSSVFQPREIFKPATYSRHVASMTQNINSAPFTRAVVNAVRRLYPESLADKTWDNTGLLLEAPFNPARRQKNRVLLTIDLTKAVADEAIEQKVSIVVAYHPIIFRGLKSITLGDTQQQSLMRLAAEGISVYSPHSAFDAAPHGLGDWLADMIAGESVEYGKNDSDEETSDSDSEPSSKEKLASSEGDIKPNEQVDYKWRNMTLHHFPSQRGTESTFSTRSVASPYIKTNSLTQAIDWSKMQHLTSDPPSNQ